MKTAIVGVVLLGLVGQCLAQSCASGDPVACAIARQQDQAARDKYQRDHAEPLDNSNTLPNALRRQPAPIAEPSTLLNDGLPSARELAQQVATGLNAQLSNLQDRDDEVVSGFAEAVEGGVILVLNVKSSDLSTLRTYVERERLDWEDTLCQGGPRDYLNAGVWVSVGYRPSVPLLDSAGNPTSVSVVVDKYVCEARETEARQAMEEARRAQQQQAAEAAARGAAIRAADAARVAAAQREAEERQAQERRAADQRREAETWHAIMTPARLKEWMTLEDQRRNSWLSKDRYTFYDVKMAMLALVSAEIARDAESRDMALRWMANSRQTDLPDLDERKLWPTKSDADLLADARAILATTEISDDRLTSRVESALSEESQLWQVQRRGAMCDGIVGAAARYREDRAALVKKALAITDVCGRYDVDASLAFLKQVAAGIPEGEVVDFWERTSEQLVWEPRFALQDAVSLELSRVRAAVQ